MQTDQETDRHAIKLIGTKAIREHFTISEAAVSHWRRDGIPRQYRRPMVLLGESLGHDMSALKSGQSA